MSNYAQVVHIVNASPESTYAAFLGGDGKPYFRRVACWGTTEIRTSTDPNVPNKRVVVGYCVGEHVFPADFRADFMTYCDANERDADWTERCKAKRAAMDEAAKKAKEQKIVLPSGSVPIVPGFENN